MVSRVAPAVVVDLDYLPGMALSEIPIGIALDELLRMVGPTVAELEYAPERGEVRIAATVIEDIGDVLPVTPGGLLLLVGVDPCEESSLDSLRRAADARFAGVVVKRRGTGLDALVDRARRDGLAVVVAADEVSWRQLDALLSSVIGSVPTSAGNSDHAGGEELFSIANAVAAVVGGAVAIEDLAQHVLAYSSIPGQRIDEVRQRGILDRRVPPGADAVEEYRAVYAADGIVRWPPIRDDLPRASVALRAGSVPLGTMWAIEEGELTPQAESALIDGAQLASLHMLRARSAFDLERLRRGELLRALFDDTGTPDANWPRLGFGPGDRVAIVALTPDWLASSEHTLISHVASEVQRVCHVLRPDAPVTTSARTVYVLLAGPGVSGAAMRLARRIVSDTERPLGGRLHAAVSSEGSGPRSVPRLRDEVDQILRVTAEREDGPDVATISDVQSSVLLAHLGDELERHPELRHPAVAALIAQDREAGTNLAASLLVWLESQQNIQTASARLHVHPNTLRYRLRRIRELVQINLDDGDQRLAVWLELRLDRGLS